MDDRALAEVAPPEPLFRLGRGPDPWAWVPWEYALPDGTFGNRWDDPLGLYRVLYASSQRLGIFIECLARFRPDPAVVAGLDAIEDQDAPGPQALAPGHVPRSWLDNRRVGRASVNGQFVAIGRSESLSWLREQMADRVIHYGIRDLDGAAIRSSVPRRFTQEISRRVFEIAANGRRRYEGIAYQSRLGDEFHNWAIFEPADITPIGFAEDIGDSDPDLEEAVRRLGLVFVD